MVLKKGRLAVSINTEEGLEVVELITEGDDIFAIVKVPVEELPNLRLLKTDKKRRVKQKLTQKKYRERKRLPKHRKNNNQLKERSEKEKLKKKQ